VRTWVTFNPNVDDFAGWPKAPTYDVGIVKFDTAG
jgi:hypothetical protein